MTALRVLVVDDDVAFGRSLGRLLLRDPGFQLVGVALDGKAAVRIAQETCPDLAIVDVMLPGGGGAAVAAALRDLPTRVVALSGMRDRDSIFDMVGAGACSYVVKGTPWDDLRRSLIRAGSGHATMSGAALDVLIDSLGVELARRAEDEPTAIQADRIAVADIIRQRRLEVAWQPIVRLADGRVLGAEALARFDDDRFDGPAGWFPAAERAGLRAELELLAVERAAEGIAELPPDAIAAINVSPAMLGDARVMRALRGLESRVVLELSEQVPVGDYDEVKRHLVPFRAAGGRIAVDDAGAGYASLRHILELMPEVIKLDISLVRDIDTDRRRRAIVAALVAVATEIGATVVGEGVERTGELEALRRAGATLGQGWLLGRPARLDVVPLPDAVSFPAAASDAREASPCCTPLPAPELGILPVARGVADALFTEFRAIGTVAHLDIAQGRWRVIAMSGPGALPTGMCVDLGSTMSMRVATGELPSHCNDVRQYPGLSRLPLIRSFNTDSYCAEIVHGPTGGPLIIVLAAAPRTEVFNAAERAYLRDAAAVVTDAIAAEFSREGVTDPDAHTRRICGLDPVAGVRALAAWEEAVERWWAEQTAHATATLLEVGVAGLDRILELQGAAVGDLAVRAAGHALLEALDPDDVVGRTGMASFGALLSRPRDPSDLDRITRRITARFAAARPVDGITLEFGRREVSRRAWPQFAETG